MKKSNWAFQRKMKFNRDPKNKVKRSFLVNILMKLIIFQYILIKFCQITINSEDLRMLLDTKLDFNLHVENVPNNVKKKTQKNSKLQNTLPRTLLVTIYKSFISFHLDYGDIIYDRAYNTSFHQNIESIQYNASLAIAGAVRGFSREKLCQKLGVESLPERRWYSKLCCLFKIINQSSSYLSQLVPHQTPGIWTKLRKHSPTSEKT